MTCFKKTPCLGLAAFALSCASLAAAVPVSYTAGDLVIGFRASSGTGSETTFLYNIGSSVEMRDGVTSGVIGNVGESLTAIYGADWYTRGDISWGIIGVRNNSNPNVPFGSPPPVVDGDPSATIYVSRAATGVQTSTAWNLGATGLVYVATDMRSLLDLSTATSGTFAAQQATTADGRGTQVAANASNSWHKWTSPATDFGYFTQGGVEGTFGTGANVTYLDLYRILATTAGAEPTGVPGLGSWVATVGIDASGNISVVPEPSTYAMFAGAAALALVGYRRCKQKKTAN